MPRAGWLALGAVASAFGGTLFPGGGAAIVIDAGCLVLAASAAVALFLTGRRRGALVAVGAAIVGLRLLAGTALQPELVAGPLPEGSLTWRATVDRVGSTDGGLQRAMLSVRV